MSQPTAAARVLAALKSLKDNPETLDLEMGLCANVDAQLGPVHRYCRTLVLSGLVTLWPLYSGDPVYPIPPSRQDAGCDEKRYDCGMPTHSMRIFDETLYKEDPNMWDVSTEYGQLRWELLEWLITTLEDHV